jgi:signal transduction histidine kinase
VCSVQDEGPGLSQGDQAKLFQRGVRLTPRPTGRESSTGFGLAVAKDLIERLGGAIWCQSALGQGSCFSFRIPAYHEQLESTGLGLRSPTRVDGRRRFVATGPRTVAPPYLR